MQENSPINIVYATVVQSIKQRYLYSWFNTPATTTAPPQQAHMHRNCKAYAIA